MQPDLGTALVYSAALFAVLFFVGLRWRQLLALLAVGVIGITAVLWLLPAAGVQVLEAVPGGAPHSRSRTPIPAGSPTTSASRSRQSDPEGSPGAA